MNRGIYYDQNLLCYVPDELWLPIPESLIPGIQPYYYISTKGRVWSTKIGDGGGLRTITPPREGDYPSVTLCRINGEQIRVSIHRIEMLLFKWIPGCEDLEVNHKDGNKENNDIANLEWVTPSENLRHAYNNGLKLKGEFHPVATHTEYQIRKICEGLEQRLPLKQCAILAGMEPDVTSEKFVSDIKHGVTWIDISSQYNIPKGRNNQLFSDDEIHQICKLLELGLSDEEIVKQVRPELDESKYRNVMRTIRHHRRFTRISDNYNF